MFQKAATTIKAASSSKKCPQCGLQNFATAVLCGRCKSDLSIPLKVAQQAEEKPHSAGLDRSFKFTWLLAPLGLVVLGLFFFYMRQGKVTPEAVIAGVAQTPMTPVAEHAEPDALEQSQQSDTAGKAILHDLKSFQDMAESEKNYSEFDTKLNNLKTSVNNALPSFVRHNPTDEIFRQEVAGALRDYTAAGNWWKTTITNSSVLTEADRNERTQVIFESARTHLTGAEQALFP